MILNSINYVDLTIILVVIAVVILIIIYLIFTYKNNPCGGCYNAKQCKASKKMAKSLLKNYKKCNKKKESENE